MLPTRTCPRHERMTTTEAAEPAYYKRPDEKVRPGDIVRLSPVYQALRLPLTHVGAEQKAKGNRIQGELHGREGGGAIPSAVLNGKKDGRFVVPGRLDCAVLLTRGCDIDHGRVRQLAAIRPLSTVQGVDEQAAIIEGKHMSLHYLPPPTGGQNDKVFGRSFVDFRYIVTVRQELFETLERPLALTADALLDLYFGWMRHTTGKEIPVELDCSECGHPVPVFEEVAEIASPPVDY